MPVCLSNPTRSEHLSRFAPVARRAWRRLVGTNERCVTLHPDEDSPTRGRVLLSYIIDGLLADTEEAVPYSHPHFWETRAMAHAFREEGYVVDVVHWTRRGPPPRTDYDVYVDVRRNFDRYADLLPASCLKIAHMDTAHHRVHNGNQMARLDNLKARRGICLAPFKLVEENTAAEKADLITVLGNEFTISSFEYASKPIHRIPLSNAFFTPFPENRNQAECRRRFLWMGSEGFVHKGLDLVLEAFAGLPEFELTICGPLNREPAFEKAFYRELYQTPNIRTLGWMDVASDGFAEVAAECIGMVYPSCSEGGGGCVLTAMHAGLIPIVSREASVDVAPDYGVGLAESTVAAIQEAVKELSARSPAGVDAMARAAWAWVRDHHTRKKFANSYRAFVRQLAPVRNREGDE